MEPSLGLETNQNKNRSEGLLASLSTKTSRRLQYEAEVAVIRKKLGTLEDIRQSLGLSRRKMAHLLMVDPSAWSRWTKPEASVPPHIYRGLQWYMALIEKQVAWHPQNSFNSGEVHKINEERLSQVQMDMNRQIAYLKKENNRLEEELSKRVAQIEEKSIDTAREHDVSVSLGWKLLVLLNFLGLFFNIVWKFLF